MSPRRLQHLPFFSRRAAITAPTVLDCFILPVRRSPPSRAAAHPSAQRRALGR